MASALPRINPTYIHWLSQQSMLGSANTYIEQVSGTTRIWQNTGVEERFKVFLEACPSWLAVNPHLTTHFGPIMRSYASRERLAAIKAQGLQGLFLAPSGETATIWSSSSNQGDPTGLDQVSFGLAQELGTANDLERLISTLNESNFQLGGLLPPAATGIGPDFMLELRAAPGFQGLYAVVEIPRKYWQALPECNDEWVIKPLPKNVWADLSQAGYLPVSFMRDKLPWGAESGWATTGVVRCADGTERRWAYYYADNPKRPVFLWQDPSGHARKIYSAAVIRHTGLQQQSLAGLSLGSMFGLESTTPDADLSKVGLESLLEPGLSALGTISQEIRRYGGWALLTDQFAPKATKYLLAKTDFVRDNYTQAAFDYGLQTGDAEPLKNMVRLAIDEHIPYKRLAHGVLNFERTSWLPLLDLPNGQDLVTRAKNFPKLTDKLAREVFWAGLPGILFVQDDLLPSTETLGRAARFKTPPKIDLSPILVARQKFKVAQGELLAPLASNKATIALVNSLPNRQYWLTCVNFSEQAQKIETQLPKSCSVMQEFISSGGVRISGRHLTVNLAPKEVKAVLLQTH